MRGTVVVGYIPTPEGIAAFVRAKGEAALLGSRLVVVNTGQGGDFTTPSFATAQDLDAIRAELEQTGLDHEVVQATGVLAPAEEILRVASAEDAALIVIGSYYGAKRVRCTAEPAPDSAVAATPAAIARRLETARR